MTKHFSAKRALFASLLSLLLCVSMLIGSTFAWFTDTDTVASGNIISGTLDVEIVGEDDEKLESFAFVNVDGKKDILWEPGATYRTEGFQIKNLGNLWLKFKLELNNTEVSYNKLNEAIDFYLVDADGTKVDLSTMQKMPLEPNTSTATMYIEGKMRTDAGNEYQGLTLDSVAVTVYATQYTSEKDMTDDQYDKDATYDGEVILVGTADQFIDAFAALEDGQIISLTNDIDLGNKAWTPVNNIGFTLNGNGKTITGLNGPLVGTTAAQAYTVKNITFKELNVDGVYGSMAIGGVIAYADTCSYINMENVTIDGATIGGAEYVGGFAGYTSGYGVDTNGPVNASHNFTNCTIKNATLTSNSDGSVGGLIGHAGSNAATTTRVNGFAYENLTLKQATVRHEKTGNMIGTANIGEVYITDEDINVLADIGRFVPGTTGKLVINGVEQTAFANDSAYISVPKNDDISVSDIQAAWNKGAGGVVDFGGSTVVQKPGSAYAMYYPKLPSGGTIKNLNVVGSAYGLRMDGGITFENCTFKGTHSPNISDGDGEPGKAVFIDCTFQSWMAFDANKVTSVEFVNCTFADGGPYNFMNSYQSATFTNCTFESGFGMDDELAGEQTWTFTNCTGLNEANLNATGTYKTVTIVKN